MYCGLTNMLIVNNFFNYIYNHLNAFKLKIATAAEKEDNDVGGANLNLKWKPNIIPLLVDQKDCSSFNHQPIRTREPFWDDEKSSITFALTVAGRHKENPHGARDLLRSCAFEELCCRLVPLLYSIILIIAATIVIIHLLFLHPICQT